MRVLWLCNVPLPEISDQMGIKLYPAGSWIESLFHSLRSRDVEIVYIFPSDIYYQGKYQNLVYFSFKKNDIDSTITSYFKKIIRQIKPDVIHIFGSEFKHSLQMAEAAEGKKVLLSIQGVISWIAPYYKNSLPNNVFYGMSFHDALRLSNPYLEFLDIKKRGHSEKQLFSMVNYISGRTSFDKAATEQMAPDAQYFHCGEILRSPFYANKWTFENCQKKSIFVSNSSIPYKGFHDLISVLPRLIKKYPDISVRTIGQDPSTIAWYRRSTYNNYILHQINKFELQDHIMFLGSLSGEEVSDELMRANVFLLASSVENSPNSLGEAMLTGTPCVCSDVGGVKDMITHEKEGFIYQQNASFMMEHYISKVFDIGEGVCEMSDNARQHALELFDRQRHADQMISIYISISESE